MLSVEKAKMVSITVVLSLALACVGLVNGKPSNVYGVPMTSYAAPVAQTYAQPSYDVHDVVRPISLGSYWFRAAQRRIAW